MEAGEEMKFTIYMKTPDAVHFAIERAVANEMEDREFSSEEEREEEVDNLKAELQEQCHKWFRYGESVGIEVDTEAGTAKVVEA